MDEYTIAEEVYKCGVGGREMTTEEKVRAIRDYCHGHNCVKDCALGKIKKGTFGTCYSMMESMSDTEYAAIINKHYDIISSPPKTHNYMTINDYQQAALRTAQINKYDKHALLLNGTMGLAGESGECIDLVKKSLFHKHKLDKEHLAKELGDVAWYLALAAYAIDYDLETVLQMNVEKLKNRYPDGFDIERSKNRMEGDV